MAGNKSPLEDPDYARFAWGRYRRMLKWMALASLAATLAALLWLQIYGTGLTVHVVIATAVGVGGTVLVGALLMGLVFLSSGSGHDEEIERFDP